MGLLHVWMKTRLEVTRPELDLIRYSTVFDRSLAERVAVNCVLLFVICKCSSASTIVGQYREVAKKYLIGHDMRRGTYIGHIREQSHIGKFQKYFLGIDCGLNRSFLRMVLPRVMYLSGRF